MKLTNLKDAIPNFKHFTSLPVLGDVLQPDQQLLTKLSEYGLTFSPVAPDGNCFFNSVALNLMSDYDRWRDTLMRVGISQNVMTDLKLLSMELRRLFVQEIVGERREMYESYTIPENQVDYPSEANKFLQDGFYASYLGDTMPPALATVLQSPIIVITANTDNTVMYITPEVVTTEYSLFLIYNPTGPGHYDAALPYREPAAPRTQTLPTVKPANPVSCSCDINSSDPGRKSCIPLEHYSTRCI